MMDSGSSTAPNALTLEWTWGFNKETLGGVWSLCEGDRKAVFYSAGQTGVIYRYEGGVREQRLLQGHCNPISCSVVSADKRWIATGDEGDDSLLVVWDAATGSPARTMFNPHPCGIAAIDMSNDGVFLVALSAAAAPGEEQAISVWEWASSSRGDEAALSATMPCAQRAVRFNPSDVRQVVTNGPNRVLFWTWESEMACSSPRLSRRHFRQPVGDFTVSAFLPTTAQAVTGTTDGALVVWDAPVDPADNETPAVERVAVKVVRLCEGAITQVTTTGSYVVVAGDDGAVRVYDFLFRLEAWFEDMRAGQITSVSFAGPADEAEGLPPPPPPGSRRHAPPSPQKSSLGGDVGPVADLAAAGVATNVVTALPDMIVGTRDACIVAIEARAFDRVDPDERRGTLVVQGMSDDTRGLALHPTAPLVLIASSSGTVYLWDYDTKLLATARTFAAAAAASSSSEHSPAGGGAAKLAAVHRPQRAAFDPTGAYLAIGFAGGLVKLLDATSLRDIDERGASSSSEAVASSTFRPSKDDVVELAFSRDGEWLASADTGHAVHVWHLTTAVPRGDTRGGTLGAGEPQQGGPPPSGNLARVPTWVYVGKALSHSKRVTGLEFGTSTSNSSTAGGEASPKTTLVSVSEDRNLVEYDLAASAAALGSAPPGCGLKLAGAFKIEESAVTTACVWHPMLRGDFEERIVTANSDLKLKQWNAENKICRKTTLGPAFGGSAVNGLVALPRPDDDDGAGGEAEAAAAAAKKYGSDLLAYSTRHEVLGIVKLPLDGNPNKVMGIIGHPGEIAAIAATRCGRYVFTAGGADPTVSAWRSRPSALDAAEAAGGHGVEPFLAILPTPDVDHDDVVDYFYYLQLRRQGEDSTERRDRPGVIRIADVPALMRALGFYPSELDIQNMVAEVRYSEFTTTGNVVETVSLDDFVRLYVNHRPARESFDFKQLRDAIDIAAAHGADGIEEPAQHLLDTQQQQQQQQQQEADLATGGAPGRAAAGPFSWDGLQALLQNRADKMTQDEIDLCISALNKGDKLPEAAFLTSDVFIRDILGFDEVDQDGQTTALAQPLPVQAE